MKGIKFTDFLRSSIFHFKRKVRISYILYYFSIYYLITFCRIIECTLDHSCPNFFFLDFVGGYFFKRNTLQKKRGLCLMKCSINCFKICQCFGFWNMQTHVHLFILYIVLLAKSFHQVWNSDFWSVDIYLWKYICANPLVVF